MSAFPPVATEAEEACTTVFRTDLRFLAGQAPWPVEQPLASAAHASRSCAENGYLLRVFDDVAVDKLLMAP